MPALTHLEIAQPVSDGTVRGHRPVAGATVSSSPAGTQAILPITLGMGPTMTLLCREGDGLTTCSRSLPSYLESEPWLRGSRAAVLPA